jgi:hypothetical protein
MAKTKSRRNRSSKKGRKGTILRKIRNTSRRVIPVVASGVKKIGSTVENVAMKSAPLVNKGLDNIYGTLATGFDMGIKGVKKGINMTAKGIRSRRRK